MRCGDHGLGLVLVLPGWVHGQGHGQGVSARAVRAEGDIRAQLGSSPRHTFCLQLAMKMFQRGTPQERAYRTYLTELPAPWCPPNAN